jgi:Xaa-Pro aminopeptidase
MFDRRGFMGSIAASAAALAAPPLRAQDRQFGTPQGTAPFGPEVYRERRQRLMEKMGGGVAVIFSAPAASENFEQDDNFAYLTGIQDEGGAAIILAPKERLHKEVLFLADRNEERERWDGERLGLGQPLRDRTGFNRVARMSGLGGALTAFASRAPELHFLGPLVPPGAPVPRALELYGQLAQRVPGTRIVNNHGLIRDMRVVKEPRELALIRKAAAATERGLNAVMRQARIGMTETQLKDIIEAEFRAGGGTGLAFPTIVAAGRSSAVLHYRAGPQALQAGDLVLCDVGASVGGYAADVTRTFPIDGRFSPEQRQVYDTVLSAQEAAMARLRAGAVYEDLHETAVEVMRKAGHVDDFWHGLGHFVGLDVHDVGDNTAPLPAGAVVTIEPGIYLPSRNFGVRIEDEYLVTASGYEHLSRNVPRRAADIEAVLAAR